MKAVARMMVHGTPLARSVSSAACLARNKPTGWPAEAPTTEISTNAAPAAVAASIRFAFPARSTEAGEMPPGPVKPCTAEITVPAPRSARLMLAGSRTSPRATSTPGPQVPGPGRVAGQYPDREARPGQARDQVGAQGAGAPGDDDHQRDPGAGPAPDRTCRRTASLTSGPPARTGSR